LPCEEGDKAFDDEPVAAPAVARSQVDESAEGGEGQGAAGNTDKPRTVIPISTAH
jgi:hypothetical protein